MSHIKLTLKTKREVWVNPAFVDSIFHGQGGTGAFIGLAGDADSQMEVTETPAEIAALIESARREARIRENAARFYSRIEWEKSAPLDPDTLSAIHNAFDHASLLDDFGDQYLKDAAERARKEGEKQ